MFPSLEGSPLKAVRINTNVTDPITIERVIIKSQTDRLVATSPCLKGRCPHKVDRQSDGQSNEGADSYISDVSFSLSVGNLPVSESSRKTRRKDVDEFVSHEAAAAGRAESEGRDEADDEVFEPLPRWTEIVAEMDSASSSARVKEPQMNAINISFGAAFDERVVTADSIRPGMRRRIEESRARAASASVGRSFGFDSVATSSESGSNPRFSVPPFEMVANSGESRELTDPAYSPGESTSTSLGTMIGHEQPDAVGFSLVSSTGTECSLAAALSKMEPGKGADVSQSMFGMRDSKVTDGSPSISHVEVRPGLDWAKAGEEEGARKLIGVSRKELFQKFAEEDVAEVDPSASVDNPVSGKNKAEGKKISETKPETKVKRKRRVASKLVSGESDPESESTDLPPGATTTGFASLSPAKKAIVAIASLVTVSIIAVLVFKPSIPSITPKATSSQSNASLTSSALSPENLHPSIRHLAAKDVKGWWTITMWIEKNGRDVEFFHFSSQVDQQNSQFTGQGTDSAGTFQLEGSLDAGDSPRVEFKKFYLGNDGQRSPSPPINFEGELDNSGGDVIASGEFFARRSTGGSALKASRGDKIRGTWVAKAQEPGQQSSAPGAFPQIFGAGSSSGASSSQPGIPALPGGLTPILGVIFAILVTVYMVIKNRPVKAKDDEETDND